MEDETRALFVQRMGREEFEDREWSVIKILLAFFVPFFLAGIMVSLRLSRYFGDVFVLVFLFLGIVIVGIFAMRYGSIPDENKLIVYPDSITFYNTSLRGKHVNLGKEEILSITKIQEDQRTRRELTGDTGPFRGGIEAALEAEESSRFFQTMITYNLHSTKRRMPKPYMLFRSKWHVYSWFLVVRNENEADFLEAIRASQFHDRLSSQVIYGWQQYWQKNEG